VTTGPEAEGRTLLTWVDLAVAADSIGVHDVLEARGELVGLVVGGRGLLALHPVEDGRHGGAALLLEKRRPQRHDPNVTNIEAIPAHPGDVENKSPLICFFLKKG